MEQAKKTRKKRESKIPESNKKTYRCGIRFSESELEQIHADMESYDYISISKYIRSVVLSKQIQVRKARVTDAALRAQIDKISMNIAKIGSNYNQLVKHFNKLVNAKRKNGDYVITSKLTVMYLEKSKKMMDELVEQHKLLINKVDTAIIPEPERK